MKKGIFKLMTGVVAMASLASCSDDLGLESSSQDWSKYDLVATIDQKDDAFTRFGMSEHGVSPFENPDANDWKFVFTEGDKIRLFTFGSMAYKTYELKAGAAGINTQKAGFTAVSSEALADGKKFGVTGGQFAYSIAPNADGEPLLTYTIPFQYTAKNLKKETVKESDGSSYEADIRKFPAPFWGIAEEKEDGSIDVPVTALTAFLRVDVDALPEGTEYIVLVTHGDKVKTGEMVGGEVKLDKHGYQLIAPNADGTYRTLKNADNATFEDTNAWWGDENDEKPGVPFVYGGGSEALSGTFNCVLKTGVKDTQLGVDEGIDIEEEEEDEYGMGGVSRLVNRDELVIKVDKNTGAFWVPVIAGTYKQLDVLAVAYKSTYSYRYVGTLIKSYKDYEFINGDKYYLTQSITNFDEADFYDINEAIEKQFNKQGSSSAKGMMTTTYINVGKLTKHPGREYEGENIFTKGWPNNDPRWNLWKNYIRVKGNGKLVINIGEIDDNYLSATYIDSKDKLKVSDEQPESADTKSKVTINMPAKWAESETKLLDVYLPTYNATIATLDGAPAKKLVVDALGSTTKVVTGHNLLNNDKTDIKDSKDAAIEVVSSIKQLNVMDGTKGDVYVHSATADTEISDALNVLTHYPIDVRISDALVNWVTFTDRTDYSYVYTTGNAAIKHITNDAGDAAPEFVHHQSYWTEAALSEYAIKKGYDQSDVYTVAQLASMGEVNTKKYKLNDITTEMWLGGETYLWIGPEVIVDDFEFDGNNVSLQNMTMQTLAHKAAFKGEKIYIADPHLCCTSCGWKLDDHVLKTTEDDKDVEVTAFGLIRTINNTTSATVKNVNLNDVDLQTTKSINNIGSLVGAAVSGTVTFTDNYVGRLKIDVAGDHVGGMIGFVNATKRLVFDGENEVNGTTGQSGYIKTAKGYVGGLIGALNVKGTDKVKIKKSKGSSGSTGTSETSDPGTSDSGNTGTSETSDPGTSGNTTGGGVTGNTSDMNQGNGGGSRRFAYENPIEFRDEVEPTEVTIPETEYVEIETIATIGKVNIQGAKVDLKTTGEKSGITGKKSYAGGLIGNGVAKAAEISNNEAKVSATGVVSEESYAGGVAGKWESNAGRLEMENNTVDLTAVKATKSYAGGLAGESVTTDYQHLYGDKVKVGNIEAGEDFAAGLVGKLNSGTKMTTVKQAVVDVQSGNIKAGNQFAGGLVGQQFKTKSLRVFSADINVKTVEATEGYAGGEVGQLLSGILQVGDIENYDKDEQGRTLANVNKVKVGTLKGAWAVGGIFGMSTSSTTANILTNVVEVQGQFPFIPSYSYGNKVDLQIGDWACTKDASWFTTGNDQQDQKAGTFSNIAGQLDGNLNVYETANLLVTDKLTSAKKIAIQYQCHPDRNKTPGEASGDKYWGDYNAYVGWGQSGSKYKIGGDASVDGEASLKAVKAETNNGFNIYVEKDKYAAAKSKYEAQ